MIPAYHDAESNIIFVYRWLQSQFVGFDMRNYMLCSNYLSPSGISSEIMAN